MGTVDSQGIKIHYIGKKTTDTKKLSLLFAPGIMIPAWIWEKQLEYFSKHYNVIAMDPRSQGDSEQTTEGHYALSMAKDIQAVVETLDLQNVVVIGWSLAVPQVVNYAIHFGSPRIVGLVLIDGILGIDPSLPFYQSMIDLWLQFQMDRTFHTREFIKSIFRQPQEESFIQKLTEVALRTPTNTAMTLINNYMFQDFRPLLPKIKIPVFIATVDGPRLGYMQMMQNMIPNSHLEIFHSAGHPLFIDQPEAFNRSLEAFLKNLPVEKN